MSRPMDSTLDSTRPKTMVRWNIFLILLLLVTVNYIDRASLSVAMPLLTKEFSLSPVMQGFLLSSFFWSYTLMQVPGGVLVDRFKPRVILALCTLFWGGFQALAALATNSVTLLLTRVGLGVAEAPVAAAGGALNAAWLSQHERVRGAALMDGGSPLGARLDIDRVADSRRTFMACGVRYCRYGNDSVWRRGMVVHQESASRACRGQRSGSISH